MFNNLIGKNKELGRFLFCERYTLPPVKNAMYIAEGQDLKRGAVVDVNGVLVGTNSLMPYAVLEFDCDTRSGGKEASVFIKGEFNFDKLTFASGLSKSDLDNVVYNGSVLGIVIKPYEYAEGFNPIFETLNSLVGVEEIIFSNMEIPESTLRFSFGDKNYDHTKDTTTASKHNTSDRDGGGTPAGYGGTWKKLSAKYANIWDYTYLDNTLLNEFDNGNFSYEDTPSTRFWSDVEHNPIKIIASNTAGCESFKRAFQGCHAITEIWSLDMSDSINNYVCFSYLKNLKKMCAIDLTSSTDCRFMFQFCSNLVEIEGIELTDDDSLTNSAQCMFQGCVSLQHIGGTLNMKSFTNMQAMFAGCIKLNDLEVENTSRVTNLQYAFAACHNLPFDVISSLDTSSVTLFYSTFSGRFGYTNSGHTIFEVSDMMTLINEVPNINMSSATDCRYMFDDCDIRKINVDILSSLTGAVKVSNMFSGNVNCESGIYEAYQVLDAIDDVHTNCFKNCGIDTEEGRAALAQIPQSWGGLAEG